jgi:hypothetical protein
MVLVELCSQDSTASGYIFYKIFKVLLFILILSKYHGTRMIVNLVILALVSLWFSYQMLFFPISIFNRLHMMKALKSLDWLVQWDDVVIGDTGALSKMSFCTYMLIYYRAQII